MPLKIGFVALLFTLPIFGEVPPPGLYWNKAQGPTSFEITPGHKVKTSLKVNNLGSGEKAKLSFPEPLVFDEHLNASFSDGDFALSYWTEFGMTRCWFDVQVAVRGSDSDPKTIETSFKMPQRFGADKFGTCYQWGESVTRLQFSAD